MPLIDRADLILTSCGPKERPLGYGGVQELHAAGLSLSEARRMLVGDISGYLLKNPGIEDREGRIEAINERLVSVDHAGNCATVPRGRAPAAAPGRCCAASGRIKRIRCWKSRGSDSPRKLCVDLDLASEMLRRV